jgi:hypothetical protein
MTGMLFGSSGIFIIATVQLLSDCFIGIATAHISDLRASVIAELQVPLTPIPIKFIPW